MIGYVKRKTTEIKYGIEDSGGMKILVPVTIIAIIAFPFFIIYYILLNPIYRIIRMMVDTPKLGLKAAFKKYFYPDQYKKEQRDKEYEEKKALESQLLPDSRQKKFEDWKDWPDAYVVDKVAVYGAGGRTLIYVDERVPEFDIPEGVENIYHRCFAHCNNLKRVSIPSSLRRIGRRAFFSCVSLKEITIPESVVIIDEEVFMNCSSLERIDLPSSLMEIPTRAFCNCRNLQIFRLPEDVRVVKSEAFRRCYMLKSIEPNKKLELVEKRAFEGCYSLKEFIMPESVISCSEGMFNGCHSLQHIHFSSQIKDFGGSCCRDCWSINQISMPEDDYLKSYAKKSWEENAEKVDISTSENPIPGKMFWTMGDALYFGIPRLTNVCLMFCFTKEEEFTIPSYVTNVKRDAFTSCRNLTSLWLSPYIKTSCDPWEINIISYDFIYDYWPQVKTIIFDESLKHTKYAFGITA